MLTPNLELKTSTDVAENEARERLVSPAQPRTPEQPAPVLITEQEVALGTAIALRAQPSALRRWVEAARVLLANMERAIVAPTEDRPPRRDYPKRYAFLQNACMAREMDRL